MNALAPATICEPWPLGSIGGPSAGPKVRAAPTSEATSGSPPANPASGPPAPNHGIDITIKRRVGGFERGAVDPHRRQLTGAKRFEQHVGRGAQLEQARASLRRARIQFDTFLARRNPTVKCAGIPSGAARVARPGERR